MTTDPTALFTAIGALITAIAGFIVGLRKAHSEAAATDTDADTRRDTAINEAMAKLAETYQSRLAQYEERVAAMERDRDVRWAEYDQARRADAASCQNQINRLNQLIAVMNERQILSESVIRRFARGVEVLLTQLSSLGATPAWLPDEDLRETARTLGTQPLQTPPPQAVANWMTL